MFSATKVAAAGAIVALFGGFLLAGVLTQPPSEESAPVVGASASATTQAEPTDAATSEPEPTTGVEADFSTTAHDLLSGVDLVTEEVEPGVFRVLDDGAGHDLRKNHAIVAVTTGPDGSVWIRRRPGTQDRLVRMGQRGGHDASRLHFFWPDISVAPDGTVWALGSGATNWPCCEAKPKGQLLSLRDGTWIEHEVPDGVRVIGIEIPADGSIWTSLSGGIDEVERCNSDEESGDLAVARLSDGEWEMHTGALLDGAASGTGGSLAVAPDGSVWLGVEYYDFCQREPRWGLLRATGDAWEAPDVAVGQRIALAVGGDGTVWAYQYGDSGQFGEWGPFLSRFKDDQWSVFDQADRGLDVSTSDYLTTVSTDGTLWIARTHTTDEGSLGCEGVLSFDGSTWTTYLPGLCALDIAAHPDGSVWATLFEVGWERWNGLYVITPEPVAATE